MPIQHAFTSPHPDGPDATLVKPSDWNAAHAVTLVEGVSIVGNTVGAGALISSGTLFLEGGNNITLSQAAGGNTILISAGVAGGGNFTAGVSTGGNTSGDTGVGTGRLILVGGNNITLSQATAAGGLLTVTISAPTQSTHAHSDAFNILSAGTQIAGTQQTVIFSDSNGIAFGMSNNSIVTASYTQSTHPHTDVFNRISAGTQIAGTQQTVVFSDSNGVAFGMSNSSVVTASYSQSTHAHTDAYNILAAGTQTANTTGTVVFSDSNGVVFGMSQSSIITASYTQSTHAHSDLSAGMSTQGNTSGDTGLVAQRLVLVGGNNVTLSQSVNGQSATLTISAFNQSVQTQMTGLTAGMSTEGNTSGTTGLVSNRLVFVGGDNITLSQSVNGQSATLTISGGAGGAGATFSGGNSNIGNTSGDTGVVTRRLVLAGGNNITLSGSTDAGSMTITISGGVPILSRWDNLEALGASRAANSGGQAVQTEQGTLWVFPIASLFPGNMSISTVQFLLSASSSNQWTNAQTLRYSFGIYARSDASQLSLLYSASGSYTDQATSQSSLIMGHRWVTFHSSEFNAAPNLSMTDYWGALWFRSSGQSRGISYIVGHMPGNTVLLSGTFGAGSSTANSNGLRPWHGFYSATFTTAMPTAIHRSDMVINATANQSAFIVPFLVFNNLQGLYG